MSKLLSPKEFGKKLTKLREARGWKAGEFARRIQKDPSELSRWENGRVSPEYDTVVMLADALGAKISEFMESGETANEVEAVGDGKLLDLWGFARARTIEKLTDLLERDRRIFEMRAEAVLNTSRAALLEVEKATRPTQPELSDEERAYLRAILRREAQAHQKDPPSGVSPPTAEPTEQEPRAPDG